MSPRTKEQNEEIRKQRRQEILRAAVLVYAEKGYAASEIGEVAERAGLARGLVYHYFKNKQTMFRELYEEMMDRTLRFTQSHFEQEGSVIPLFSEYVRMACEQVLNDPPVFRFYTRISLDVHYLYSDEEFSPFEWVKNFLHPMVQALEKGLRLKTIRPGDANLMAMQFWGAVSQGMNYLDRLQQELVSREASKQEMREQVEAVLKQVTETALAVIRRD